MRADDATSTYKSWLHSYGDCTKKARALYNTEKIVSIQWSSFLRILLLHGWLVGWPGVSPLMRLFSPLHREHTLDASFCSLCFCKPFYQHRPLGFTHSQKVVFQAFIFENVINRLFHNFHEKKSVKLLFLNESKFVHFYSTQK